MGLIWERSIDDPLLTPEEPHAILITIGTSAPDRILPERVLENMFKERWQKIYSGNDKEFIAYPYEVDRD